jgi:hypothetical protein
LVGKSETFLDHISSSFVSLNRYNFFSEVRTGRKWGGFALFVNSIIPVRLISEFDLFYEEMVFQFLHVEINLNFKSVLCCVIYLPHNDAFLVDKF